MLQSKNASKLFAEDVKKHKKDEATRKELQALRQKLNCGGTSNAIDAFDDLLNSSSNKVQKTRIDVKSENAKRFRDMFDKGEVPEKEPEKQELSEKDAELAQMRKNKREQREYFKKMEEGKLDEPKGLFKEPKLHVGKIKNVSILIKLPIRLCFFWKRLSMSCNLHVIKTFQFTETQRN